MSAKLHLLGTGAGATDAHRTTTMLAFSTETDAVLVDCGGDVLKRAMQAGIPIENIRAVILTHEHPDHVGGWALFVEKVWLHGRQEPILVYGPEAALEQADRNFGVYNTEHWKGLPEVSWQTVPLEEGVDFLDIGPLRFSGTPVDHGVPCMAVRVDNMETGGSVCYSSDTRPTETVARLGAGCDILVHEANGVNPVHSTAEDAAEIGRQAGCGRLVLVHLPAGMTNADLSKAREIFSSVELGEELAQYSF
jgi:ribonuclease Z